MGNADGYQESGPGIHAREVPGLEKLKGLPNFRLRPVQSMAMTTINRSAPPAVQRACYRALELCCGPEKMTLHDAAVQVREQGRLTGRPIPHRAVGSTLLLKGLEAEVAVILDADGLVGAHQAAVTGDIRRQNSRQSPLYVLAGQIGHPWIANSAQSSKHGARLSANPCFGSARELAASTLQIIFSFEPRSDLLHHFATIGVVVH